MSETLTFRRVGLSTLRSDGVWTVDATDVSESVECNTNYLPRAQYDSRCGHCYLGNPHSQRLHNSRILKARWEIT